MKNYLVTGGTNGIGRALIELLLKDKNNYIISFDVQEDDSQDTNLKFIKVDLSDRQQILQAMSKLVDMDFDGLFLNAGIHVKGDIFEVEENEYKKAFDINIFANITIIKALKENIKKGASIVFNGSDQCFVAKQKSFAYGITKGAIAQMTKSLALDLAKYKIRVNAVCPGTVDTNLYQQAIQKYADNVGISFAEAHKAEEQEFPLGRIANPQEVAELVLFLLSDKSKFMTGGLIPIDGGYTAK